jgi:hypothetical protein
MTALAPAGTDRLHNGFHGELISPREDGYDAARKVWNGAIDRRPALIARTHSAADVVTALRLLNLLITSHDACSGRSDLAIGHARTPRLAADMGVAHACQGGLRPESATKIRHPPHAPHHALRRILIRAGPQLRLRIEARKAMT